MLPNNNSPKISIIIPTLNEEKLISDTLSQFTHELRKKYNLEVIISDGGSKDDTLDIAREKADKVILADQDKKQNISIGRNTGAKNAEGLLFYFFNGDTRIKNPDLFFQKTLDAFQDNKTIALSCHVKVFPEIEKLTDKIFHNIYNRYVIMLNILGMGMGRGECHMMKREYFLKAKGYNENLAAGEDFDLYRRLKKFGKIKFLKDLTVYESPRRYRKFGYWGVFYDWTKNSISVLLKNKSLSKEWEEVR